MKRLHAILLMTLLAETGCNTFYAMRSVPLPPGAREIMGVAYYQGKADTADKHRLDIYAPAGKRAHPVVVFIHGGAWIRGDRKAPFDVYQKLGRKLAARGILTVVPSYRLAPRYKYPNFERDAARAVAWVQRNIARYGGRPNRIFLMGHSAGAQMAALLVCDPAFLRAAGADPARVSGLIGISGPYDISYMAKDVPDLTREAFGSDRRTWLQASPATHLEKNRPANLPPFLIAYGTGDPDALHHQAREFEQALHRAGASVENFVAEGRNHFTIIIRLADEGDPLGKAIEAFVKR